MTREEFNERLKNGTLIVRVLSRATGEYIVNECIKNGQYNEKAQMEPTDFHAFPYFYIHKGFNELDGALTEHIARNFSKPGAVVIQEKDIEFSFCNTEKEEKLEEREE